MCASDIIFTVIGKIKEESPNSWYNTQDCFEDTTIQILLAAQGSELMRFVKCPWASAIILHTIAYLDFASIICEFNTIFFTWSPQIGSAKPFQQRPSYQA